jgi:hypothetical protein
MRLEAPRTYFQENLQRKALGKKNPHKFFLIWMMKKIHKPQKVGILLFFFSGKIKFQSKLVSATVFYFSSGKLDSATVFPPKKFPPAAY